MPLIHEDQDLAVQQAQDVVQNFSTIFRKELVDGMRAKLGIFHEEAEDEVLFADLLKLMHQYQADYTNTFIALTFQKKENSPLFESPEFKNWQDRWEARLNRQKESEASIRELMKSHNPAVIPRNHRVEAALEAASQQNDFGVMEKLLQILSNPFAHSSEQEEYATPPEPSCGRYVTFCGT